MRQIFSIISLILSGAIFISDTAQAQSRQVCPNISSETEISLDFDPGRIVYDDNISREELARLTNLSPYSSRHAKSLTMGLTSTHYVYKMEGAAESTRLDRNHVCARLKSAAIKMTISKLKIYILRDYAPGSCEYDTVLSHEHLHADIAQRTIRNFMPRIRRQLRLEVNRLGWVRDISSGRAFDTLFARLHRRMKPVMRQMERQMKRANAAIDTPKSYLQFNARCQNWGN